jgi:hypothetical protein
MPEQGRKSAERDDHAAQEKRLKRGGGVHWDSVFFGRLGRWARLTTVVPHGRARNL